VEKPALANVLVFVRNGMTPVKNAKRKKLASLASRKKNPRKVARAAIVLSISYLISYSKRRS
jgi:hypothetical protein